MGLGVDKRRIVGEEMGFRQMLIRAKWRGLLRVDLDCE